MKKRGGNVLDISALAKKYVKSRTIGGSMVWKGWMMNGRQVFFEKKKKTVLGKKDNPQKKDSL